MARYSIWHADMVGYSKISATTNQGKEGLWIYQKLDAGCVLEGTYASPMQDRGDLCIAYASKNPASMQMAIVGSVTKHHIDRRA